MDDADRSGRFQHLPVRVDALKRQSGNENKNWQRVKDKGHQTDACQTRPAENIPNLSKSDRVNIEIPNVWLVSRKKKARNLFSWKFWLLILWVKGEGLILSENVKTNTKIRKEDTRNSLISRIQWIASEIFPIDFFFAFEQKVGILFSEERNIYANHKQKRFLAVFFFSFGGV